MYVKSLHKLQKKPVSGWYYNHFCYYDWRDWMKLTSPSLSEWVKPPSQSTLVSHGARDIKCSYYYRLCQRRLENICSRLWALLKISAHIFYELHKCDCGLHPVKRREGFSLLQPSPLPGVTLTEKFPHHTFPIPSLENVLCSLGY